MVQLCKMQSRWLATKFWEVVDMAVCACQVTSAFCHQLYVFFIHPWCLDATSYHVGFPSVIMVSMVWYGPTYLTVCNSSGCCRSRLSLQLGLRNTSVGLWTEIFAKSPKMQIDMRKFLLILLVQVVTLLCTSWVAAAQSPKTGRDWETQLNQKLPKKSWKPNLS